MEPNRLVQQQDELQVEADEVHKDLGLDELLGRDQWRAGGPSASVVQSSQSWTDAPSPSHGPGWEA
ncbi:hypothetical protein [Kitasatospora sp. NPDC057936]|uniref:hypothetical protein n=1 Tax=Kitasatospora sp. NPDC057936 TaxID=3346283 RepID=UPI0036DEBA0A